MLRKFESELLDKNWKEIRPGLEVKTVPSMEGANETFILCRSQDRKEKEKAILEKAIQRLEKRLESLAKSVREGKLKDRTVWRSLEMWMNSKGLGTCARKLLNEMKEVRSMDVLIDIKDRNTARLRLVGKPEKHLLEILDMLGIKLPNKPKNIKM